MMDFVDWPTRTGCTGLITIYLAELSDRYYTDPSCQIPIQQSKLQSSKYSFLKIHTHLTNVSIGRLEMLLALARAN